MAFSLPPPLEAALIALAERFDAAAIEWVVCGSTARALLGFSVVPRDLDVEVDITATRAAATCVELTARPEQDTAVFERPVAAGSDRIAPVTEDGPLLVTRTV